MTDFNPETLINLDECVLRALRLFIDNGLPNLDLGDYKRPLVVGSGNAAATGRILVHDRDAVIADESTYKSVLEPTSDIEGATSDIDGAIVISASGAKHAPEIVEYLKFQQLLKVSLLTCKAEAPASQYADRVFVFPSQPEPYTYNTSTYMSMIIAKTKEDPQRILDHIRTQVDPLLQAMGKKLGEFDAFYILVPGPFDLIRIMIKTKFVELFGRRLGVDVFTVEQAKHATTVVQADKELFISFGAEPAQPFEDVKLRELWGPNRLAIPLPQNADALPKNVGYAAMMAVSYYVVGRIQALKPAWFKDSIEAYCKRASEVFGETISPIVE